MRNDSNAQTVKAGGFKTSTDKLIQHGAQVLTDVELLDLVLQARVKGTTSNAVAEQTYQRYGSVTGVMNALYNELSEMPGIGRGAYARLQAGLELAKRRSFETLERGNALTSPDSVKEYIALQMTGHDHEVFACLYLDNRHRVLAYKELFVGCVDSAAVFPSRVIRSVMDTRGTAALILVHGHPSGLAEPSDTDVRLTAKLVEACNNIDCRILDHIIQGQGVSTSLAERGLM